MTARSFNGNPSQIIIEQLAASGTKYLFYNPGSREARFFDSLQSHTGIHGIVALHEGTVAAMAGGYAQVRGEPAVMSVHLGAGLAQALGQMINVWAGSLPVVMITFHGDTGSYADRITLDLGHNVGPTSISAPFTKANWTVIEPGGLAPAVARAIRVAKTPPIGPVHLAVYDRLLGPAKTQTTIVDSETPDMRAGYPSEEDLEYLARTLHEAERPLIYVGDGVWKSGAEKQVIELAERFGAAVGSMWGDLRGVPVAHPQHLGYYRAPARNLINPDHIVCIGVRHGGNGSPEDYAMFANAKRVVAVGADVEIITNIPDLDRAVLADEKRTVESLLELTRSEYDPKRYDTRREWARKSAAALRADRRKQLQPGGAVPGKVRAVAIMDAVDAALESMGGGLITTEQFAVPMECVQEKEDGGRVAYIRPAGGSEGFGMGAPLGAKLAAPDKPVVGLVGDGSVYYSDSAFWTAAHHRIPVLYVIPNNSAYGIVAGAFAGADGVMKDTGKYEGVALEGIDIIGIAKSFGVEGRRVTDEAKVAEEVRRGLETVEKEGRPMVLDVAMPSGLPNGGKSAPQFQLAKG